MSTLLTDVYSDIAMHCPGSYYGGYKAPRVTSFGDAEVALSDFLTGENASSTFRFSLADVSGAIRAKLHDPNTGGFPSQPITYRLTTRANRAVLGDAYTAFIGRIVDAQPVNPHGIDVTLADFISHSLLSDRNQQPWRLIRDGFVESLVAVSERLDLEQPEPILLGRHTRAPGSAASSAGYRVLPIYLGIENVDGDDRHVWLVAGHACKSLTMYVDDIEVTDAGGWLIPHQANWASEFGAAYVDKASSTFGNDRRYTLIYGPPIGGGIWNRIRGALADRCAVGDNVLSAAVEGIEEDGDGTGDLIVDFYQQYKHFSKNYGLRRGLNSYQSGAWLSNPTITLLDGTYTLVDEASFDTCTAIGLERFPGSGLEGAIAIGLRAGDRSGVGRWTSDLNRSGFCRSGQTVPWKFGIATLHPTVAVKESAPRVLDYAHILRRSFATRLHWDRHATSVPGRADFEHTTARWRASVDIATGEAENYDQEITGEIRERPFACTVEALTFHNTLEATIVRHPPRAIRLEARLSPDRNGVAIAALNLGSYIRYTHIDSVGGRSDRLAWIEKKTILRKRAVAIEAVDCQDLIGFDEAVT